MHSAFELIGTAAQLMFSLFDSALAQINEPIKPKQDIPEPAPASSILYHLYQAHFSNVDAPEAWLKPQTMIPIPRSILQPHTKTEDKPSCHPKRKRQKQMPSTLVPLRDASMEYIAGLMQKTTGIEYDAALASIKSGDLPVQLSERLEKDYRLRKDMVNAIQGCVVEKCDAGWVFNNGQWE